MAQTPAAVESGANTRIVLSRSHSTGECISATPSADRVRLVGCFRLSMGPSGPATRSVFTPKPAPLVDLDALKQVERITKELDGLRALRPGWDTYDAPALDAEILSYAERVFARVAAKHLPIPSVVPTVTGGVQFEWHTAKADVEVEVIAVNEIDIHARSRRGAAAVAAEAVTEHASELIEAVNLLA